ncbi:MAG: homocysteine S-methyltransferase family protein, partial [Patescibacteria group bacterium]|nr:homocysteine S-methyltransferase family protein [Patescibacteria group bacterium]
KKNLSAKKAKEATQLACKLAKNAIKKIKPQQSVFIAGSVAPLEDCYSPKLTPSQKDLRKEHLEYIKNLKNGGVDFILLETMITLEEIKAAIETCKELRIPFAVSFCIDKNYKLLGGATLKKALQLVNPYKPLFVGINCISPKIATQGLLRLKKLTKLPISIYAQGDGEPEDNQGWQFKENYRLESYLLEVKKWIKNGAKIVGGCCGTTPEYIQSIKDII